MRISILWVLIGIVLSASIALSVCEIMMVASFLNGSGACP